ncbi:hypothetical protein CC1G_08695 [Coprinopsis cinerea okayama7|uniref:AB hydrolase-1 domain-containing protein n=1 Tax=Coprinopsis cinerea (strain Okayama-7 / 130 / ATCC MYA-4618 / FGSC 9003) TaxID=240176 RepID=A8NZH6_COPC7|nr:hypothetical protein CC1G_08695 [Coprinopsis cinerea okayama7\|eukprot:XP_001837682.1 hypothetical protein CC1G_08695 [Coprinopsis cinerea okayama7\
MSSKHPSYPQVPVQPWEPVDIRPLLPIYPPPEPLEYPDLPTPQRKPNLGAPFELTTHIIPACYLRTGRFEPVPPPPPEGISKEERSRHIQRMKEELRFERGPLRTDGYPKVLWNCINRYSRKGLNPEQETGLTLFFAHANGFPKEIWEPTIAKLLSLPSSNSIDEIWTWESVQHGDPALINRNSISKYFDWQDNTRDIVNFLTNFLPARSSARSLPLHLKRIPETESLHRRDHGFLNRRIMVVGHSYGGCTSTLAVENFPKLFSSLVLIDPVMPKPFPTAEVARIAHEKTDALLTGSLARRDVWSSREEALASFLKNPFFQAWHIDVLKVYVEAGLYDSTDSQGNPVVRLKMPGIYESIIFAERTVGAEAYQGLATIPERIPIRWIMPGREDADEFGAPGATQERCWTRPANSSNVKITGAGHLIAQEAPIDLAEDLDGFIQRTYPCLSPGSQIALRSSL